MSERDKAINEAFHRIIRVVHRMVRGGLDAQTVNGIHEELAQVARLVGPPEGSK